MIGKLIGGLFNMALASWEKVLTPDPSKYTGELASITQAAIEFQRLIETLRVRYDYGDTAHRRR